MAPAFLVLPEACLDFGLPGAERESHLGPLDQHRAGLGGGELGQQRQVQCWYAVAVLSGFEAG